jgi:hypothetical protein
MQPLSVLIPVYNFDVVDFVSALHKQFMQSSILFEIRLYDDCSQQSFKEKNREINTLLGVVYRELEENIGRSKIRNLLAREAKFDCILFFDCDMQLMDEHYAQKILQYPLNNYSIIIGGTHYQATKPTQKEFILHWKAGKFKEEKTANERNKSPLSGFTLNNLLIKKEIYLSILLDESLQTYGHEDSKFGYNLIEKNISIFHTDNPVIHIGLNRNDEFIKKTEQAVQNLCKLINEGKVGHQSPLYKTYRLLKKWYLRQIYNAFFNVFKPLMHRNLVSKNPSLYIFDLYKLGLISRLNP